MKKSQLKKLNKIIKDFEFDLFEKYEVYLLNNQDLKTRIVSYFHSTHITLLGYYYDFSVDKFYILCVKIIWFFLKVLNLKFKYKAIKRIKKNEND